MQPGPLNPARLFPGMRVGDWRIVDLCGCGAFGVVYLVEGVAPGATGLGALKLALAPRDERFGREAELLSRIRHPCVPRLLASGEWRPPGGPPHPYVVMEWVEGLPLYEWARACAPSSRQVLGLLAGLARALEATHAAEALHRDVKGDNVWVRLSDGRGFLIDFGAGHHRGASRLTWQPLPPGTPAYRSPEAFRFERNLSEAPGETYAPGPADDLFALGVTAYRLVTWQYPPLAEPEGEGAHVWAEAGPGPQPARALNSRCTLELSGLISRLLSPRPEARGSAREMAEALERASQQAGPEADEPLFPRVTEATPARRRAPFRSWRPWLAAGLTGAVALSAAWVLRTLPRRDAARERSAMRVEEQDAGVVAVGDSTLTAPGKSTQVPAALSPIALDLPANPFPGQIRPDARGRCPRKSMVAINGGCWTKVAPEDCEESSYVYKGRCYDPAAPPPRPPTSSPTESPEGPSRPR
jgi:serine/threonine-protein kinase